MKSNLFEEIILGFLLLGPGRSRHGLGRKRWLVQTKKGL